VDDDDPPPLLGGGQAKKIGDLARILDDDLAAQAAAPRIIGPLDGQKIGMTARRDTAKYAAFGIDRQSILGSTAAFLAARQQEARQPKGKGRLADAAWSAQQNGVRQPVHFLAPPQ